jgi:uncharacterized protein YcfJ
MKSLTINALTIAMAAALSLGLAGCNRNADAGTSADGGTASGTAAAQAEADNYGKVVSVDPVRKTVNKPRQVCKDEVITHTTPPKDEHRIAGTAIGAVAGGLLGNQIGGGKGKTLATVAGAVGGGYAGNRIQANRQHANTTSSVERHCDTVNDTSTKLVGYDVRYEYKGVTRTVRMDHDPGDRVKVEEGVTAVSDAR